MKEIEMNTTYLNPVDFRTGDIIEFTTEGLRSIKPLLKLFPEMKNSKQFFIVGARETQAEDEFTELLETTKGCTALKCVSTGKVFEIDPEDELFWAFFTNFTSHFFNKV
ncbi:hypothetical protein ABNavy71_115 [Acinetobacter phage AB-Navy71]|nr:hypothetical protein ABNavy71_115 [Acinetobacter phage AB-Navy71]